MPVGADVLPVLVVTFAVCCCCCCCCAPLHALLLPELLTHESAGLAVAARVVGGEYMAGEEGVGASCAAWPSAHAVHRLPEHLRMPLNSWLGESICCVSTSPLLAACLRWRTRWMPTFSAASGSNCRIGSMPGWPSVCSISRVQLPRALERSSSV